jgi:hypothetical protein
MPIEQAGTPEQPQSVYSLVYQFAEEAQAAGAYARVQLIIYTEPCDLSSYRFLHLPEASWYVAVVGSVPSEQIDEQLKAILSDGIVSSLPSEIVAQLLERRAQQIQRGSWVERHLRPIERTSQKQPHPRHHQRRRNK